jgi:hypothetical protein
MDLFIGPKWPQIDPRRVSERLKLQSIQETRIRDVYRIQVALSVKPTSPARESAVDEGSVGPRGCPSVEAEDAIRESR